MKKPSCLILLLILGFVPIYSFAQLSARQERNLTAFTKLYGYVRYFYPGDEAQQINWDMMAVYGSGQVLNQPNDKALIAELQKLFLPVAPAIKIGTDDRPPIFNKAEITPPHPENYKVVAWQRSAYDVAGGYVSMRTNRGDLQAANQEKGHLVFNTKVDLRKYPGQSFLLTVKEKNMDPAVIVHELRDSLRPYYLPRLSARPAKLVNDIYQITDTIGSQPKTLAMGLNSNGKSLNTDMHLYIYNHGQKIEVPLQWQGGDWAFYEPGTKYYALSFIDPHFTDKPLYATQADIGACVQTTLVKGITCMVPLAIYGDLYNTYPKTAEPVRMNELKQHIAQTRADIISPDTRFGDVAIAWNVFQHFFPYWSDASKTPQQLLHDALLKAYTDKNATDFFYTTKLMCAALNDGHMFYNSNVTNEASAPLVLAKAEGKMVIKFVLDSALNNSISPGDVVDAIDGEGAIIALKQKMKYMSGSPQCKERDALAYILNGPMAKPVSLTLHHQGKIVSVSVNRSGPPASFRPGNFSLNPVHNGLLKDGIYYYDLSGDSVLAKIRQQLPQLLQAKAIIMDMRGYPNSPVELLICQLLKHDDYSHWLYGPQYIYPDHQQVIYHPMDWKLKQAAPHIDTRIYYLIDASTQSAAESYSGYFKDFKLATIIGQPTAGANGGVAEFRLPAMNNMSYSGQLVTNHDGSKEHINGIVPDIVVELTIKGITEGRDEILERAVAEAEKTVAK